MLTWSRPVVVVRADGGIVVPATSGVAGDPSSTGPVDSGVSIATGSVVTIGCSGHTSIHDPFASAWYPPDSIPCEGVGGYLSAVVPCLGVPGWCEYSFGGLSYRIGSGPWTNWADKPVIHGGSRSLGGDGQGELVFAVNFCDPMGSPANEPNGCFPYVAGGFTVTLSVTGASAPPVAAFIATPSADPARIGFDGSTSTAALPATVTAWAWDFGDGVTGSGVTPSHPYARSGDYEVSLTVTDSLGLHSLPATKTVQVGGGLVLDWSMVDRFDGTSKTLIKTADQANPSSWKFRVTLTSGCVFGDIFVFHADGQDLAVLPNGACSWEFDRTDLKPFTLEAAKVKPNSDVVVATGQTTVAGRDFLIVSIGDSLSSGEGAPQVGDERWTDARCDRSMLSGAAQAALLLENSDPHSTVSFVHLACSGATSDQGLMGPFGGVAPDGGIEPAQIAAIASIARGREIDAVTMSIGANDVAFGEVLKHCIEAGVIRIAARTNDPPFIIPDCFANDMPLMGQTLEQFVATRLAQMPVHAAQIESWFDQVGVDRNRVFSYDYPDGTHDQNGVFCGKELTSPMTQPEWQWAYEHIAVPLNDGVASTAAAEGWNYVGGFGPLFAKHGYCSTDPWVETLPGSVWAQNAPNGAFHPNATGYQQYAAVVFAALKASLFPGGVVRPARSTQSASPTMTTGSTPAGATEIPVQFDHFKIGDHVVVGIGALLAEPATISGKGSLIFDAPLKYAHGPGESIVLADTLHNAIPAVPAQLAFYALSPVRVVDTRPDQAQGAVPVTQQKYGGGTILRVLIAGSAGVPPSGAGAVSLNVTVVDPDGPGYVTVFPCGGQPLASNLNFVAGQTVPNAVIAPVSTD
ncbi:MAG: uncharacterized protein JWM34_346, partial [Ilumatobacteraceae bacterium]|nr:uncharacterized protein [Ilumatobacteraceae bacterium]